MRTRLTIPPPRHRLPRHPIKPSIILDPLPRRQVPEQRPEPIVVWLVAKFQAACVPEERIELRREADGKDGLDVPFGRPDELPGLVVRGSVDVRPGELAPHEVDEHVGEGLEVVSA
jgi:hypothetical protein